MALSLVNLTFTVPDVEVAARFWAAAAGLTEVQRAPGLVRLSSGAGGPLWLFLQSETAPGPAAATGPTLHLDLSTTDPVTEVHRLHELGATLDDDPADDGKLPWRTERGLRWLVLRDPSGLPFCIGDPPRPE